MTPILDQHGYCSACGEDPARCTCLEEGNAADGLAADIDYLRRKLADMATSAWDQSCEHRTQKRWELRGVNKALRYCQTHLDWLLDVRHRPGGPNPLAPQTPPTEII